MIKLESGNFFQYETIGRFTSEEQWLHPARTIYSFELILVLNGEVFIEEDGARYELRQNDMIILEPQKYHFGYKESAPPVSFYWTHFRTDMEMPFKTYTSGDCYDLKYLLKKLLHVSNTPSYPPDSVEILSLLIFRELMYTENALKNSRRTLINEAAEYVRINLTNGITVSDTAKHFGYNSDYIGKLFKNNYGMGLKEYICAEKIKLAKDFLLASDLSVKEISAKLGFDSENLFIKFFMYHEDISPSKFRNKYFNTHMNNK